MDAAYASTFCRQGHDALNRHDHHAALLAFGQCLSYAPDDPDGQAGLALTFALLGENEHGLQLLQRAALMRPDSGNVHFALAGVLERLGRPQEAFHAYRQALVYEPQHVRARERATALGATLGMPVPAPARTPSATPIVAQAVPELPQRPVTVAEYREEIVEVEAIGPPPQRPPRPPRQQPRQRRFPAELLLRGGESFGGVLSWRVEEAEDDWLVIANAVGTRYTCDGRAQELTSTGVGNLFGSTRHRSEQLKDVRFVIARDQFFPEKEVCDVNVMARSGQKTVALTDVPTSKENSISVLRTAVHMALVLGLPFHLKIRPNPTPCQELRNLLDLALQYVDP